MQCEPSLAVLKVIGKRVFAVRIRQHFAGVRDQSVGTEYRVGIAVVLTHGHAIVVVLSEQFQQFEASEVDVVVLAATDQQDVATR